jgi:hypothetical protein
MNRLVLGLLGGSLAIAAVSRVFAPPSNEQVLAEVTVIPPTSASERSSERSRVSVTRTNETTSEVSRAVKAGIADAVGEAVVRVRDQAAANASAEAATPIDPPSGVRPATPEEEEKFRRIRQALGETPEKEASE